MIPLFKPAWNGEEPEAVSRVIQSGRWTFGPETQAFEQEFAAYTHSRHAVAVNSSMKAVEIAAWALAARPTVAVVPSLAFIGTAHALQDAGCEIVFADTDDRNLTIDWDDVRKVIAGLYTSRVLSEGQLPLVVPFWYSGMITEIPQDVRDKALILEDCSHAAGSLKAGWQGHVAAWSFHATANLATGDGGMITTQDDLVAERLRRYRNGSEMTDIQAAVGRVQLKWLDARNSLRRDVARYYGDALKSLEWVWAPVVFTESSQRMYVIRVHPDIRDGLISHMQSLGVSAGVHYEPLNHLETQFPDTGADTPVTEKAWKGLVTLPLFPGMQPSEMAQVVSAVSSFRA